MAIAILRAPALARRVAPLTLGHGCVDFTQGALPVLIPYLDREFQLSYKQDGLLVLALTVSSSIAQPLFGHLSDRRTGRLLLPASIVLAGGGLVAATLATSFALVLLAVFVGGLGVAAYHPEASSRASALSAAQPATGMSLFSVGGNLGFALGPAYTGAVLTTWGLGAGWLLAGPALIGTLALAWALPGLDEDAAGVAEAVSVAAADDRPALNRLLLGLCVRGYVFFGVIAFIPLFEERVRERSAGYGPTLLGLLLAGGALGTLLAGPLADRVGPRSAMVWLTAPVAPLLALYVLSGSPFGAAAAILAGGCVISTFSLSIVAAQSYLPSRPALAAGLSIGLSIGVGGAFSVLIGTLADALGLRTALWSVAAAALLALLVLIGLPEDRR